jgi:ribosome modulation factor
MDYYDRGYEAYQQGLPTSACPFEPGGEACQDWLMGWWHAEIDDKEKDSKEA